MTRYSVQLTTTDSRHSVLLHTSRSQNFLTTATRSVAALLAVLSVTLVGFLGMVTSAAPASANFGDMLADVTCRTGVVGLAIEDRAATLSPTTGNGKTQSVPTPYEKYGLSGLTYSQWIGFDTGATLDRDDGKGSLQGTRSIVAELGEVLEKHQRVTLERWSGENHIY